ncbi:MAG TPA: DUF4407 domain-containing protein [Actinospica sp.]|jgi:hypothetical protein|nr:DUF4407 domain-containing protein [Actinospica sp.]
MFSETLGSLIARLGGANKAVLDQVPQAKSRFLQMGLVLLSTSGVAVVSMSFALTMALRARLPVAILLGFVWGFIILNIDRLLIQNIRLNAGVWRTLVMVLTRLAIAGLLSVVISTPLVLQVFSPEIQTQMTLDNANQINQMGDTRAKSPAAVRLASDTTRIATDQAILRGDQSAVTPANVAQAQTALSGAQSDLTAATSAANDAYQKMVCELNGQTCDGASGSKGDGPRYEALKKLYQIAETNEADAQQTVAKDQQALQNAQSAASQTSAAALAQAQTQARNELPGLIKDRNALQAVLATQSASDSSVESADTGLLARISALNDLGRADTSALLAHWAVAALLFMIELMPVLVKVLMTLGPPTLYDRVSELMDDSAYDAASQQRNFNRRRIEQDSKKTREIEDDMRKREVALGIEANKHVAGKMKEILDVALVEWSNQLSHTMQQATAKSQQALAANGNVQSAKPAPSKQNGSASQAAVRSQYNLPNGGRL